MAGDPPTYTCQCGCHNVPIFTPDPSPRYLPVNIPFPQWSSYVSVAILDHDGNVTIYAGVDNPYKKQDIE